jgi:hypothetical protein
MANISPQSKKWLIGCGGCLIVLILLVAGIIALGGLGFNYMKQASEKTTQELLGKKYEPPANYTVIGLPWGQKDLKSVILMVDAQRGTTLMLIDTLIPSDANKLLKEGKPDQISQFIQEVSHKATSGPGSKGTQVNVSDLRLESVQTAKLKNGKTFPLCTAKTFEKNKGTYSPVVIAMLPEAEQRLIIVMALDPRNASTDPKAHFHVAYQNLEQELLKIINDSDLDDRLQ